MAQRQLLSAATRKFPGSSPGLRFSSMMENNIVAKAKKFAKREYKKNDPKHQWSHVEAVMKRALEIADQLKNVDYELLKLAVIFHDIDYNSELTYEENYDKHVENSIKIAENFLLENEYPLDKIKRLKQIMLDHSTPHRKVLGDSKVIEGKIIYDADKSIFITNLERYKKYFPLLYFEETKRLVKKPTQNLTL
jgi:putative nucleotidyltransferase with HDIG domain